MRPVPAATGVSCSRQTCIRLRPRVENKGDVFKQRADNLQIFYINLDRRTDRREFMERQLATLGLEAERVPAVTPDELPPEALRFCDDRRDRWVAPVELSCSYSHRRIWQMLVERNLPGAIVFEDDAVLSSALPKRISEIARQLKSLDLIRLETRLMPVLVEDDDAGWLRRLYSFHFGSAGYAVSRKGAECLLENEEHDVPVDDYLFSPEGPMYGRIQLRQAYPGLSTTIESISASTSAAASDITIEGTRRSRVMYEGRHRVSAKMIRYGFRRSAELARSMIRRLGSARRASWRRVPFAEGRSEE